jgi:hypothetical protein
MPKTRTSARVTSLDLTGPFFKSSPSKSFRANVKKMMEAVAAEGQEDVRTQLRAGAATRRPMRGVPGSDRVAGHVIGRARNLRGKQWQCTAVVSVNNSGLTKAQGKTLMAAASQVEQQTHAFRRTATRLRKARAINRAELLRGLQ